MTPNPLSPEKDTAIHKNYSIKSLKERVENKLNLQKELALEVSNDIFLVSITTELTDSLKGEDVVLALQGILEIGMQVVLRGKGTDKYKKLAGKLINKYPQNIRIVEDADEKLRKMYAGADASIFLSHNKDSLVELNNCMKYGSVPISIKYKDLERFDPIKETGNAFIITKVSPWHIFEACVRAKETFSFPYDWSNIQKACMAG